MKIALYSDLHLEFSNIFLAPKADLVVLAGDIWTRERGITWALNTFDHEDIVYVPGNHEFYGQNVTTLPEKLRAEASARIQVLMRNELILAAFGVRILGCTLWTDFQLYADKQDHAQGAAIQHASRLSDFSRIRHGLNNELFKPQHALELHLQDRMWLEEALRKPFDGKTIVVTHHAPSIKSVGREFVGDSLTPCFASSLEHMMPGVDLWLHGHTHHAVDYMVGDCRVVCNPRGYESNCGKEQTGWNPDLVIEV